MILSRSPQQHPKRSGLAGSNIYQSDEVWLGTKRYPRDPARCLAPVRSEAAGLSPVVPAIFTSKAFLQRFFVLSWRDNMEPMNAADLRAFCARDWQLIERVKSDCWLKQKAAATPSAGFELGADLLQYARAVRPDWPNTSEREADLAAHIRVASLLQRVSQIRSR
jgi:hypothetical protein